MANEFIARKGLISSGSIEVSGSVTASGFFGTASIADKVVGGAQLYVPLWSNTSTLSSSLLYQTASSVLLGATTQHTPEAPDRFGVFAGVTDSYNLISAHGETDQYLQLNVKNFSSGQTASADIVATADTGDELGGFIDFGINSSNYGLVDGIGGPLDAYLYSTGSDLLIGNTTPDKRIILFTGPGNAANNARVYIDSSGSVGINTQNPTPGVPEALIVQALTDSYNLITAKANLDNYTQINIKNFSGGNSASADIVATNNTGNETTNYIDMGINSDQYNQPGLVGGPNDAYLYSTGNMLHIGNASENQHIMFFAGGFDAEANNKLTLDANNNHSLSGSLNVTGSINVLDGVVNNLTASFAVTASYVEGAASDWNTLSNKPDGLVSSSTQVQNYNVFATTGSNVFNGSQTITGSLIVTDAITAQQFNIELISSSVIYESGSTKFGDSADDTHQFTGSLSVLGSISGSLILPNGVVSSSTQAANWTVLSASFATSASWAPAALVGGTTNYIPLWSSATAQSSSNIFQSASNIGIGTTNPVSRLTISGNITITGSNPRIRGDFSSSPISSRPIFQSNFTNGGTSVYVIPNGTNPNATVAVANDSDVDNASIGFINVNVTEFSIRSGQTGSGTYLPFTIHTSGSEKVRVTPDGNVGIGTTTPVATLDVDGNVNISGSARRIRADFSTGSVADRTMFQTNVTNGNTVIYTIPNGTGQSTSLVIGNNSSVENISLGVFSISTSNVTLISNKIGTGAFLPLTFQTSGSEKVRIDTDGDVGIGTTAPGAKLHVQGNVSASSYTSSLNNQVGFFGTSSWAVSSSRAITSSFATTASAATSITFTPTTASFSTTSSFASNAQLLNGTGSLTFATTGSNNFNGTQTITGSLLLTTDIVVFSGSFTTSGSFAISGSLGVTGGITGSLFGTSSWANNVISSSFATTASAANSITFTPVSASFATTASAANSITFIPSSASFATTASAATSITFTPTSASFATTASAATSITFTPTSASFATTSSYAVTSSFALSASFIDGGFY